MSIRQDIIDTLYNEFKSSGKFKHVYKNIIPALNIPRQFPSVAIAIDNERLKRDKYSNCMSENEMTLVIMLYHKGKTNSYTDIVSPLVDDILNIINNSSLQAQVVDMWVDKISRDGGILHPNYLAEIDVKIIYRQSL